MTHQEYLKEFSNFLKEKNAFGNFRREFNKSFKDIPGIKPYNVFDLFRRKGYDITDPRDTATMFLFYTFGWISSKEGPEYWIELNREWIKKVNTYE